MSCRRPATAGRDQTLVYFLFQNNLISFGRKKSPDLIYRWQANLIKSSYLFKGKKEMINNHILYIYTNSGCSWINSDQNVAIHQFSCWSIIVSGRWHFWIDRLSTYNSITLPYSTTSGGSSFIIFRSIFIASIHSSFRLCQSDRLQNNSFTLWMIVQ